MLSSFRHPRRRRVSVGPQSEADAREYLANREQRRAESRSARSPQRSDQRSPLNVASKSRHGLNEPSSPATTHSPGQVAQLGLNENLKGISTDSLQVNAAEKHLLVESGGDNRPLSEASKEDDKNDRKMFSALEKPRTHYDVEVITKLVIYAGIVSPSTVLSYLR